MMSVGDSDPMSLENRADSHRKLAKTRQPVGKIRANRHYFHTHRGKARLTIFFFINIVGLA
jgi:hypothetical protein